MVKVIMNIPYLLSTLGNQEVDTLSILRVICPQMLLEVAHWIQIVSGQQRSNKK